MKSYDYYVIDVFTSERFRGNPLSVVFTESDLQLSSYENISREFGYSETSFIYYSSSDKSLRVRSFTPTGVEVGGAGHNLLGAVYGAIAKGLKISDVPGDDLFVIMKNEKIHLKIDHTNNEVLISMLQRPALIEMEVEPPIIANALSLSSEEILSGELAPSVVKTEVAHLLVPLQNLDALNRCIPDKLMLAKMADDLKFEGVYCFVLPSEDIGYLAETRFFNPGMGIDEDPATGSAAGPLAGYLFQSGLIQLCKHYQLLQGKKINHPSVLRFEVTNQGIWVSGQSVTTMEGTIHE